MAYCFLSCSCSSSSSLCCCFPFVLLKTFRLIRFYRVLAFPFMFHPNGRKRKEKLGQHDSCVCVSVFMFSINGIMPFAFELFFPLPSLVVNRHAITEINIYVRYFVNTPCIKCKMCLFSFNGI